MSLPRVSRAWFVHVLPNYIFVAAALLVYGLVFAAGVSFWLFCRSRPDSQARKPTLAEECSIAAGRWPGCPTFDK